MNQYRHIEKIVVSLLLVETHAIALLNWPASWPSVCANYLCQLSADNQSTITVIQRAALPENPTRAIVIHDANRHRQTWEFVYDNSQSVRIVVESSVGSQWPGWDSYTYRVLAARIPKDRDIASIKQVRGIYLHILYLLCFDETERCVGYFVLYWRT